MDTNGTAAPVPPPAPAAVDPLDPEPGRLTWQPVATRFVYLQLATTLAWTAVLALGLLTAFAVAGNRYLLVLAIAAVGFGAFRAVVAVRAARSWGYAERPDDLLVRHGLLVRRLSIVPYARMQFVDVTAGPLERALDLATVTLHTAAAASDATVPGLSAAEAARLRDRLTALGQAQAEGL